MAPFKSALHCIQVGGENQVAFGIFQPIWPLYKHTVSSAWLKRTNIGSLDITYLTECTEYTEHSEYNHYTIYLHFSDTKLKVHKKKVRMGFVRSNERDRLGEKCITR